MKKVLPFLMTTATLLLVSIGVMAQGGATPFVGSTHNYTVEPESTSNTLTWSIVEPSGYTINSQTIVGDNSVANITWTNTGTYKLQFTEWNETTNCATIKELEITVSANTFDVFTSDPIATCNAADGVINYSGSEATTLITFTIDMTTANTGFSPNWEITFTLDPGTATLANVSATTGTLTESAGTYTLTAISSASGDGSVDITLDVTGGIYAAQSVVLDITSAKELTYNTPDVDSDDWTATQTINPIPQTSEISTD
ncbi:MAG: hypothetical protein K0B11_16145 [Mariniphaga sp.]|nr:hypothetical protein [Mariniphaga sp.]